MAPVRSELSKNVYKMLSLPVITLCFLALPGFTQNRLLTPKQPAKWVAAAVVSFDVCVTDAATHDNIQFSSSTGAYSFTRCKDGLNLSGTGTIRKSGSIIVLNDKKPDRLVNASFLANQRTGRGNILRVIGPGIFQTVTLNQTVPGAACGCP